MMDFNVKTKGLWTNAKQYTVRSVSALSSGLSFEELFSIYVKYVKFIVPSPIEYATDCVVAYFLFHLYLFYVLLFSLSRAVWKHFKVKGSRVVPEGNLKEKASIALTYFFVFQSISRWTFGLPNFNRWMGWVFQMRPQINFKPQIKLSKSNSKESTISVKNKIDASVSFAFESEDEDTRKSIKNLNKISKGLSFASDLGNAVVGSNSSTSVSSKSKKIEIPKNSFSAESSCDDSELLVRKWLEDQSTSDSKTINEQLLKMVAQDCIRKRSMTPKEVQETVDGVSDV